MAASLPGALLLDPSAVLPVDADGLVPAMTHDGVHLTPEAYVLWSAQLSAAIPGADPASPPR